MNTEETSNSAQKTDRTLAKIITAIILVAVLNAGISLAIAFTIQNRFDIARQQQVTQGQEFLRTLCKALESPHSHLGELAIDLKC